VRHEPRTCPRHDKPLSADGYCDECGEIVPEDEEAPAQEISSDASLDYASPSDEEG
jgi:hypothetical protein